MPFLAFLLLLLHPAPTTYLDKARAVTASIQQRFYNQKSGLYAQSLEKREPEFMWGNGVMFSALVAATRHDPHLYRPVLDRFFGAMDRYWDKDAPIPGYEPAPTRGKGHDKYYDDNQWMVITFVEAFELTHEEKYLQRADAALAFSLSGWDDELDGGIWWHEQHKAGSKNTCANGPAAVASLCVARHRDRDANLAWAHRLVEWTSTQLQDDDGLFFDNIRVADRHVNKGKLTYNAALMLRANIGLYRETGEATYLDEAKRISVACTAFIRPNGAYRDALKFSHLLVEGDLELYRVTGDATLLERAKKNADAAWSRWLSRPPSQLIEQAGIARMLWLVADHETPEGRGFWERVEGRVSAEKVE
jgi:hypothetical protein